MPRRGKFVASQRVGDDEWWVAFSRVTAERTWEFEAYTHEQGPSGMANLFWSASEQRFTSRSRLDVPIAIVEKTVAWIAHVEVDR
jgi:hypothetical protein